MINFFLSFLNIHKIFIYRGKYETENHFSLVPIDMPVTTNQSDNVDNSQIINLPLKSEVLKEIRDNLGVTLFFCGYKLNYKDFGKIFYNEWLTDRIVDSFFEILKKSETDNKNLKVYVYSTLFYLFLEKNDFENVPVDQREVNIFAK
ncbi:hypothetical protein M153_10400003515 [Pseudoloma neurophilia]|uniref:Uncharacterized protein n=1 Tax=Pseudoloma neurophilia TaxID=146866 RepID=A0A0R0M2S9_9MICR|nr:hypothetical protein M153_10400003515 [Pseudoloma neurophilia]